MYQITSHDDAIATVGLQNARARRLTGPSGTDGCAQTFARSGDKIISTTHSTHTAPLVIGFVRRLTDAIASPVDNEPFTCTIEPALNKEDYDCVITLSPIRSERQLEQLHRFIEHEDTFD